MQDGMISACNLMSASKYGIYQRNLFIHSAGEILSQRIVNLKFQSAHRDIGCVKSTGLIRHDYVFQLYLSH